MADEELKRLRNLQRIVRQKEKDRREKESLKAELEPTFWDHVRKALNGLF